MSSLEGARASEYFCDLEVPSQPCLPPCTVLKWPANAQLLCCAIELRLLALVDCDPVCHSILYDMKQNTSVGYKYKMSKKHDFLFCTNAMFLCGVRGYPKAFSVSP